MRRLLLLPLLSPLLAALLVGALNPRPAVSLRLLTWRSPAVPLGAWIAAAAAGGAALSGSAAALSLHQGGPALRRRQRRGLSSFEQESGPWEAGWPAEVTGSQGRSWFNRGRRQDADERPEPDTSVPRRGAGWSRFEGGRFRADHVDGGPAGASSAGPSRAAGEPAPTVSVPFRVIRRASAEAVGNGGVAAGMAVDARAGRAPMPEPVPVGADEDWGEGVSDDW